MSRVEKSLDELGFVSRGRSRHRPRDAAHLYGGPYPFVQTADVKHAGLYLNRYQQTYSDAGLAQSKLWPAGTLCITIAANIADTAILGIDACFPDSVIGFIADADKSDARFIKYQFDALLKKKYERFSQGVAQDNLSQEKLLSLKISIPEDVKDQCRVADVLAAYDGLIANNARRISLLETAGRMLFEEWFARRRYPGLKGADAVQGLPAGWSLKRIDEIAACNNESYSPKNIPDIITYVDISSVKRGIIQTKTAMTSVEAPGRARRIARNGDVIWSNVRPNLKQYALILDPDPSDVFSTGFTILSPVDVPSSFLYCATTTEAFVQRLVNFTTGASYPAVRAEDFQSAEVLVPTPEALEEFDRVCAPQFRLREALIRQNRKLERARDLLLPRLMDGRIAV